MVSDVNLHLYTMVGFKQKAPSGRPAWRSSSPGPRPEYVKARAAEASHAGKIVVRVDGGGGR